MSFTLNRRTFAFVTAAAAAASVLPGRSFAQGSTRSVTTVYGTYDIPAAPQRVVAIDSRLDLQPALALGLPVVGYGHSVPGSWVPVDASAEFVGSEVNVEQVLALNPDLIICSDYDPDSVWWPANKLKDIAPVVPTSNDQPWKTAFRELAALLGREGEGETAFGEYDALIADIKARRAEQIASKIIINIQPGDGVIYGMNGSKMLVPQVLADLGAKTVVPAEGQDYDIEIAPEQFGNILGNVDGFILATSADEADPLAGLSADPLWQRLPAVANGIIRPSNGNVNYGSIYSAIYIAQMVDELYGKLV